MQPSPETTLVIVLGASEYPKIPKLSNEAFRNSATGFKKYLLNRNGFALPKDNLLDLFDSSNGTEKQNELIGTFLQERIEELKKLEAGATDLILYYVGHGTFVDPGNRYILALKNIKEGSEEISGFPIKTLANTLKDNATFLRRYVILDCCFSAAAFESFQNVGPLELARQKTQEYLPQNGTALLCASGPKDAAKAPSDLKYTMFSTVLLDILERGSTELPEKFSLWNLGLKAEDMIRERFSDTAVRPQILSPDQTVGDVAKQPIFPNFGLGVKALRDDLSRIEVLVSSLVKAQEALETEHSSLKGRLDNLGNVTTNAYGTNLPDVSTNESGFDASLLFKFPWLRSSGLTKAQWDKIPSYVKSEIIDRHVRLRNGKFWLLVCFLIVGLDWTSSIWGLILPHFNSVPSFTPYKIIADALTMICFFIAGPLNYISVREERLRLHEKASMESLPDDYDEEILAKNQKWISFLGLEIEKRAYSLSQLIYKGTIVGILTIRFLTLPTIYNLYIG
jgi:hypothetical protein